MGKSMWRKSKIHQTCSAVKILSAIKVKKQNKKGIGKSSFLFPTYKQIYKPPGLISLA